MARALSLLSFSAVLMCLAPPAAAQITTVPGSGCASASPPTWMGEPKLGQRVDIRCPPANGRGEIDFFFFGTRLPQFLPLGPPLMCTTQSSPCNLDCLPLLAFSGIPTFGFTVPNDQSLIGAELGFQCGFLIPAPNCLTLAEALSIVVEA